MDGRPDRSARAVIAPATFSPPTAAARETAPPGAVGWRGIVGRASLPLSLLASGGVIVAVALRAAATEAAGWAWAVPFALSVAAFAATLLAAPSAGSLRVAKAARAYATCALTLTLAHALGTVRVYAVALAVSPALFVYMDLATQVGLHRHTFTVQWIAQASAFYATVRAVSVALQNRGAYGEDVTLLAPFVVSSVETVGMVACARTCYAFEGRPSLWWTYASLKGSLFLALPLLETSLLRAE